MKIAKKEIKYFSYIFFCLVWMVFIFYNSSLVGKTSSGFSEAVVAIFYKISQWFGNGILILNFRNWIEGDTFHFLIRKAAHFFEFAILGILYLIALGVFKNLNKHKFLRAGFASAMAFLYAISDEIHQIFVVGRVCSITDVLIDSAGAVVGILSIMLFVKTTRIIDDF